MMLGGEIIAGFLEEEQEPVGYWVHSLILCLFPQRMNPNTPKLIQGPPGCP